MPANAMSTHKQPGKKRRMKFFTSPVVVPLVIFLVVAVLVFLRQVT